MTNFQGGTDYDNIHGLADNREVEKSVSAAQDILSSDVFVIEEIIEHLDVLMAVDTAVTPSLVMNGLGASGLSLDLNGGNDMTPNALYRWKIPARSDWGHINFQVDGSCTVIILQVNSLLQGSG